MAKKQTNKPAPSESDWRTLTAIKALDRAGSALAGRLEKKSGRLPAGSYAMDLTVRIVGDLVVAPDVETSGSEGPTDKPAEILAAIFADLTDDAANALMRDAMETLKRAETSAAGKDALAVGENLLERTLNDHAKRRKRWRETPAGYRGGATTGSPAVSVIGAVNGNEVSVRIEQG